MTSLTDAATEYINAGLSVITLAGKLPNTDLHRHGVYDAISGKVEGDEDMASLARFFEHEDTTGIGIPLPAHMVVVDIDGEEGAQQFRELVGEEFEAALETPAARTGRGLHLWYATPREQGNAKLGPKLDLKGIGGYVAAPPSRHPDGAVYTWLDPLVKAGLVGPIAWLPAGIERVLDIDDQIRAENHVERPTYWLYNLSLQDGAWRLRREVCPPPIDGLIHAVETAEEGNRNNILAWATLQARDEGVTLEVAMRDLGGAAEASGLSPQEVRTTIRAAYRRRSRE
jgi:hypothetical protein